MCFSFIVYVIFRKYNKIMKKYFITNDKRSLENDLVNARCTSDTIKALFIYHLPLEHQY